MEIYRVKEDDLAQLTETKMNKEKHLEQRLVRATSAQIGDVEIFYVGRQEQIGGGSIFDILGVDRWGNAVIVELKRGGAPRKVITQGLEYASKIRNVGYEYLDKKYEKFMREERASERIQPLREAHSEHFDLDDALSPDEFNHNQRLIIVASSFQNDDLFRVADFLREHGIDVIIVEYSLYQDKKEGFELLTTDAIRRPLSEEPSSPSEDPLSDRDRRRKEFWEEFSEVRSDRGLPGGASDLASASYAIYVFTEGRRNRPAYIRPTIGVHNEAYILIRFYDKEFVRKEENRNAFENAVGKAVTELDLGLSPSIEDDLEWDREESRDFDKVQLDHKEPHHDEFTDEEKLEEIRHWFADVAQVYKSALLEMEENGRISSNQ